MDRHDAKNEFTFGKRPISSSLSSLVYGFSAESMALGFTYILGSPHLWVFCLLDYNIRVKIDPHSVDLPHRGPGRPRMRWDDVVQKFCEEILDINQDHYWSDMSQAVEMNNLEDHYVAFMTGRIE